MNGSDVTPSKLDEVENCDTRIGWLAVIWDTPSTICWNCWPAFSVATGVPLTLTSVPSSWARNLNVSPLTRVLSGTVRNERPHVSLGNSCSVTWSQAKKLLLGMLAHWWPPKTATRLLAEIRVPVRSEVLLVDWTWYIWPASRLTS